jgi:hypothetical protein
VQAPIATTHLGSGICRYNVLNLVAILKQIVPATTIISACRGVARATSNPNLDQSCLEAPACIISIAQQLVPNVRGQSEFKRDQLINASSFVNKNPPSGIGSRCCGIPKLLFVALIARLNIPFSK